ncbi:MAG: beta-lactamase family protein, partial [Leptospiraceae bacterium]|nr:beta-lactamase family protein [Leptospiraceae bacterium]
YYLLYALIFAGFTATAGTGMLSGKDARLESEPTPQFRLWQRFLIGAHNQNLAAWLAHLNSADREVFAGSQVNTLISTENELDNFIDEVTGNGAFPGLAVAIYRDGVPVFEKENGLELSARRQLASVTKTFTSVAVLQLAQHGRLNLDDDIGKYFPDLQIAREPMGGKTVTIRNLLQHNSGIPYHSSRGETFPSPVGNGWYSSLNQIAPAGETFMYSNFNYYVLAAVIEKVSGKSYAEYIQSYIFDPAGMTDSEISPQANGASGISSSVNDLARFFIALTGDSPHAPVNRLLNDRYFAELYAVPAQIKAVEPEMEYYGSGIRVQYHNGKPAQLFHTGIWYGVFAEIRIFLDEKAALVQVGNPPRFQSATVNGYRWRSSHLARTYVKLLDTMFSVRAEMVSAAR